MCGINVIVGSLGSVHLLAAMNAALAHRGPDGEGAWISDDRHVALGHRRLAILDVSDRGRQPMADPTGDIQIVFNGEIYNFRELRSELESFGHVFRSGTDTEVILAMYRQHGRFMLNRLNGMFAFALYDGRTRDLLVARDRTGMKPLYYARLPDGGWVMSSELKALLRVPGVDRRVDHEAIRDYLTYQFIPDPGTPFSGVRRLPPGHLLQLRQSELRVEQWYSGQPPRSGESENLSLDAAADQVRSALSLAVERQMVSDRPVGAFLSGGLDSSAVVAAMAQKVGPDNVRCYTVGYEASANQLDPFDEDLPHAQRVAERLGVHLEALHVRSDTADLWPMLVHMLDEPIADPAAMNAYLIARHAREDGTVVLLTGQGADELFGGYRRHVAGRMLANLDYLPAGLRRAVAASTALLPGGRPGRLGAVARRVRKLLEAARGSADERFLQLCAVMPAADVERVLSPSLRSGQSTSDVLASGKALLAEVAQAHQVDRMLYRDLKTYLPAQNLHYTDRSTMAAGVEARVPFLDDDLLDLALRLPPDVKLRGMGQTKVVLREAVRPWLPLEVLERPKTGFGVPLRGWLRGGLAPMVHELLSEATVRQRGLLDPMEIQRQRLMFDRGEADYAYAIFTYLTLELWCRAFLDGADVGLDRPCTAANAPAADLQPV
ncbi:MAG: asparagine synthase (glutamine-hydrolyzing) [Chloroflexota bacterium]